MKKSPIADLVKALEKDEGYYLAWKATIAMTFIDEYNRTKRRERINNRTLHALSNRAADFFIHMICRKAE